jgi:hypothetical protein
MAKNPKSQDPTEAALSAIEEALQMGGEAPAEEQEPVVRRPLRQRLTRQEPQQQPASRGAAADEDIFGDRPRPARRLQQRPARGAANDDRQSVGQILAALHFKPSYLPFQIAGGASALWVILTAIVGYVRSQTDIAATTSLFEIFGVPGFWIFFVVLVMPPVVFFILAAMIRRTQEMRSVSSAMTEVTLRLAEPEGVSTDAIVSVGQAIRREVAALGDGIERAIARATELETMVRGEVSTLERAYDDNELRVRTLVEELQSERDAILSHTSRLREAMSGAHESFNLDVEGISGTINSTVNEAITRVTDNLVTKSESARTQILTAGDVILESLTVKSNEVLETYTGKSSELTDRLTQVGVEVAKAIVAKGDAVGEVLTHRLKTLEESIAQRGNEIADRVATDSAALGRRISDGLQGFDTTVKVYGTNLLDQITQTVNSVNENTRLSMGSFTEGIDARIARVEQTLDARTQSLNETLASRTLEFARTISDGAKNATDAVDKSVAGMGEYFATKSQEIATTLSERAEAIDQKLGKGAFAISESLDERIKRFEEQVVGRLETISGSIENKGVAAADALSSKVEGVTQHLRDDAAKIEKTLTELSEQASKKLIESSEQLSKQLVESSEQISKNLVEGSGQVGKNLLEQTQAVIVTQESLRNEVNGVLDRLSEANKIIMQVYDGVTQNLGPIEGKVAERVASFQDALEATLAHSRTTFERMDHQASDLRVISESVLRDVSTVAQRFEDQGRFIAGAADTLQDAHRRIDQTLSERRDAIERFASQLATRATDLEERLQRFNRMLEDTLGNAEGRAHDIAKLVAETATQSTQEVSKQYELLRTATDEQREQTSSSMKATYDKTMDEVKALFSDTTQRFSASAQELRQIAEEVQQSLDLTRQDLKRGVFELPHETRESTEAMRRVVADQIKALSELNEIVSRQARAIDLVEPRRVGFRPEAIAGGGGGPRSSRGEPATVAEFPRTPRMAAPRGEPVEPLRPVRDPRRPVREPREAGERGGGWLTDLLARASSDEEQPHGRRSPLHAIESLDSLSVDIARMIDHDAAVELWDRYKRGERNVFTRKLYTNQGQKTFEEIRKKYRKSAEFRDTVDRYIEEFERLLDQVSRDDRGQVLSRTYLTSDTGKVYTLLAHAAGRLD